MKPLISLLVMLCLVGCAGYRLTPLPPTPNKPTHQVGKKRGYVFYAPQPFLLGTLKGGGTTDKDAVYEYKIVYLPDYSRPYEFTRYEFLAKSDLKITFTDGWQFTGAESSTDTTAALSALVELAKTIKPMNADGTSAPAALLYRIVVHGTDVSLVGPVNVTAAP